MPEETSAPVKEPEDTQELPIPEEAVIPEKPVEVPVAPQEPVVAHTVPRASKVNRDSWLNRNIAPLIAIVALIASFGFFAYILNFDFSAESKLKDISILLIGIVSTLLTTIVNYYFGSSLGSSNKSRFIENGKS